MLYHISYFTIELQFLIGFWHVLRQVADFFHVESNFFHQHCDVKLRKAQFETTWWIWS